MQTKVLILNADPVFADKGLTVLESVAEVDKQIVRTLAEAVMVLLGENVDAFLIEAETALALEQATNARQHFPSLKIVCLISDRPEKEAIAAAKEQNLEVIASTQSFGRLRRVIARSLRSVEKSAMSASEGIDPCHSLIGNLTQFSAAEILQMSCLSQRSGRFTFKSRRGNSEIYLQQGAIRHAVFGSVEGEAAVAEIFRWRQGRFYFEEGIISQVQTVNRPWAHLLIDNLQKLDETLELASV
ncbi:MAG TPA: DUF4388 domain-containing protein [Chthoniobacterales bacterium]|jgi:hypothetical protein|nr:DUF4388 domain-containing protein [Chthoniobacterales bacterium]